MIRYFKNKRQNKIDKKQRLITAIKKVHDSGCSIDSEVEKELIKAIKRLNQNKNPEYVAYQLYSSLNRISNNRYDYQNDKFYYYPKPIEELIDICSEIGEYYIRLSFMGGM